LSEDAVTFLAAFPAIQSAIKVYGDKQGMRIQLDIPESAMAQALSLLMWRERVLEVTVRPSPDCKTGGSSALEQGAKRQPRWQAAET